MDENHFISLLLTLRASRILPSVRLRRIASPLNALHMQVSDSCKIKVLTFCEIKNKMQLCTCFLTLGDNCMIL